MGSLQELLPKGKRYTHPARLTQSNPIDCQRVLYKAKPKGRVHLTRFGERARSRHSFNSFTYPSVGDGARIIGNKLRLQHVGWVRINLHRPIEGEIKTISVKREGDKWYVIAACQLPDVAPADVSDKPITSPLL